MIHYHVIDVEGIVVGYGDAASEGDIITPDGCSYYLADGHLLGCYITASGKPKALPDRPSPYHRFNRSIGRWTDPRDTAQRASDAVQAARRETDRIERLRAEAYRNEADPLFFKMQRGEATELQWQDAIAAIKSRYPKSE